MEISLLINKFAKETLESSKRFYSGLTIDEKAMNKIVELCYLLSTCHEESKFISCRIAFGGELLSSKNSVLDSSCFWFKEPIALELDKLRKIALSSNPEETQIVVEENKTGEYEICCLCPYPNQIDIRVYDFDEQYKVRSFNLINFYVVAPGVIRSYNGNTLICEINQDKVTKNALLQIINKVFSGNCDSLKKDLLKKLKGEKLLCFNTADSPYSWFLFEVIKEIVRINHGGTLIVCNGVVPSTKNVNIKYKPKEKADLWSCLVDAEVNFWRRNNKEEYSELTQIEINRWIHMIAQFSAVDGAVLLTKKLEILGYGAELLGDSSNENLKYYDEESSSEKDFKDRGTRHRSACRFCRDRKDAVAFVISQDGGISCMVFDDQKKLVVVRRGEHII